ncbi:hypothetical protein ACFLV6_02035 [Chloroflexota bacterium]
MERVVDASLGLTIVVGFVDAKEDVYNAATIIQVDILTRLANGTAVAAKQGEGDRAAFHPELSDDLRFHRHFLRIVASN